MYVEAFMNKDPEAARRGHSIEDELVLCYAAHRPDLYYEGVDEVEHRIFEELNGGSWPDSDLFPSLSVGDVISLSSTRLGADRSIALEHIGYTVLPEPRFATAREYNDYRHATGKTPQVRVLIEEERPTIQSKPRGVEVQIIDMDNPGPNPMTVADFPPETQDGSLEAAHQHPDEER